MYFVERTVSNIGFKLGEGLVWINGPGADGGIGGTGGPAAWNTWTGYFLIVDGWLITDCVFVYTFDPTGPPFITLTPGGP